MSEYTDKIKAKIKEADVEGKLSDLVDEGEKLLGETVAKAGDLAHEHRADVQGWLDKASGAVNEKTEGKYAEHVTKLTDALLSGLDLVAARRSATEEEPDPGQAPQTQTLEGSDDAAWGHAVDDVTPD